MASVHHLKIENSGKKGQIGNIDIRLSLDKDDTYSNDSVTNVRRQNRTRENLNPEGQLPSSEYDRERSRNLPTPDDSESDCDTDVDTLYADNKADLNGYRALNLDTVKLINEYTSQTKTKYKQLQSKKLDKSYKNMQKQITKFFKKTKNIGIASKMKAIMKVPSQYLVYGLGSYFDGEQSDEEMNSERNRFSTFYNYTGNGNPRALAQNGFYHKPNEGPTSTVCFRCQVRYDTWIQHDDVFSFHQRLSPNCTVHNGNGHTDHQNDVRRESENYRTSLTERNNDRGSTASGVSEAQRYLNVANLKLTRKYGNQERPTGASGIQASNQVFGRTARSCSVTQHNQGQSQMGNRQELGSDMGSGFGLRLGSNSRESITNVSHNIRSPGAFAGGQQVHDVPMDTAKNPDFVSLEARVRSFNRWPAYTISPRALAEAGFFYAGDADFVRCFCCDGGLRNWDSDIDPWIEHARWFPSCEYIKRIKGERYVAEVQRQHCIDMEGPQRQQNGGELTNDPNITEVARVMQAMHISSDHARNAVMAVRRETGLHDVTVEQAMNWYFDRQQSEEVSQQAAASTCPEPSLPCTTSSTDSSAEYQEISAENRRLKELTNCKICMERKMSITFLPCGHLVCCETCAEQIRRCPTCRININGRVKTFMPL